MAALETDLVLAWHEALNSENVDRLVALCVEEVEVGGPKGSGHGSQLLREWVGRARIRLDPQRVFHSEGVVVVQQSAQWASAETGEMFAERTEAASVFRVHEGRIAAILRYPDLAAALPAAGLDESSEVSP